MEVLLITYKNGGLKYCCYRTLCAIYRRVTEDDGDRNSSVNLLHTSAALQRFRPVVIAFYSWESVLRIRSPSLIDFCSGPAVRCPAVSLGSSFRITRTMNLWMRFRRVL